VKLALSTVGTLVLLGHMGKVREMARIAAEATLASADHRLLRTQLLVHAAGGVLVLLTATVLSVFKPWGRTPYGQRIQREGKASTPLAARAAASAPWSRYVLLGVIGVAVLMLVLHLAGGGPRRH
jgi:hypothetical protein